MADRITFEDLKAMDCDWISATQAASAMRMNPGRLIEYARKGELQFTTRISGDRVLVGRVSLLKWAGQITEEQEKKDLISGKLDEIVKALHDMNVGLASMIAITLATNPEAAGILEKLQGTMWDGGAKQ